MKKTLSLKSYSSRDEILVNNYVMNLDKDLRAQVNNLERNTFSKNKKKVAVNKFVVQYHLYSKTFILK